MKLRGKIAITASSVLAFGTMGLAVASTASATTDVHMCWANEGTRCAFSNNNGNRISLVSTTTPNLTNWNYPISQTTFYEIKQTNTERCMQAASSGYVVEETCDSGTASQGWEATNWGGERNESSNECLIDNQGRVDLQTAPCKDEAAEIVQGIPG